MYRFIVSCLQPYLLMYLITGSAIIHLWIRRRDSRPRLLAVTAVFLALTALSIPAVSFVAVRTLERPYPPHPRRPADAGAIVVFAAGLRPPNAVRARAEMDQDTLYRCLHAAELYHQGNPCLVLLSGGKVDPETPGPTVAEAMRDFLLQLGVNASDLILETSSRTTYENALESRKLLDRYGIRKVVLVADAVDVRRALLCLHKQAIEVIPSPCHYRATEFDYSLFDFLPSPSAAENCQRVFHEWLGVAWYWLHGRI